MYRCILFTLNHKINFSKSKTIMITIKYDPNRYNFVKIFLDHLGDKCEI